VDQADAVDANAARQYQALAQYAEGATLAEQALERAPAMPISDMQQIATRRLALAQNGMLTCPHALPPLAIV